MKVLVATNETQGQRENDFCFVPEGELLRVSGSECSGEEVDGHCGCRRSFVGTESQTGCTTAKVLDFPYTVAEIREAVHKNLKEGGWLAGGTDEANNEWVEEATQEIIRTAERFEVGTVVERRGDIFQARVPAKAL